MLMAQRVEIPVAPLAATDMARRFSMPASASDRRLVDPSSTEDTLIPGETEEDGKLIVLVEDTHAVEFKRTVDGKSLHNCLSATQFLSFCH